MPCPSPLPREGPHPVRGGPGRAATGGGLCRVALNTGRSRIELDTNCQVIFNMTRLTKLLDKSRDLCGSDSATADRIGVSRSAVSVWRKGGKITPEHLAKLVEITGTEAAEAVAILSDQDGAPAERKMWATLAKQLGTAAVIALCAIAPAYPTDFSGNGHGAMHLMS